MWLILFGGAPFKSDTIIIELNELVKQQYSLYQMYRWTNSISISLSVQGGDKEWSLGRVLKRDKLSNNTVYQDMLREGRRKGLPIAGRRIVAELEQEIQHLQEKVSMSHSGEQ